MRLEFPDTIRELSLDEQVAFLDTLPSQAVSEHLDEVAGDVVSCLPNDAQGLGERVAEAASQLPLYDRYSILRQLHGYAEALDRPDLQDFQRYNTMRSLGSMTAFAERGLIGTLDL